jgi:hypothetical protein
MTMETFEKVIAWVDVLVKRGTQTEINLHGIGEPTMNPLLVDFVRIARDHLPPRYNIHLNTNGNHMTEELAMSLKKAGINQIDVTGHDARSAARTVRILKKVGIFGCLSMDFILFPNNWAGQVDWFPPDYSYPCPWLDKGQVMVMWDGTVLTCCIDAFATNILGSVYNGVSEIDRIDLKSFKLCDNCHSGNRKVP